MTKPDSQKIISGLPFAFLGDGHLDSGDLTVLTRRRFGANFLSVLCVGIDQTQ